MKTLFTLGLLAALGIGGGAVAAMAGETNAQRADRAPQEGPCPADEPGLRSFINHILTSADKASERQALGFTAIPDQPLRALGSAKGDPAVCAHLYRAVPKGYTVRGKNAPDMVVFYQVGNRYVLALTGARIEEGVPPSGPEQYMSFDQDLNRIGRVLMP